LRKSFFTIFTGCRFFGQMREGSEGREKLILSFFTAKSL